MCICDDNIKMDIKEPGLDLYLILQHSTKQSGIFGKVNGLALHKNGTSSKFENINM
jgi:hypothetical protein